MWTHPFLFQERRSNDSRSSAEAEGVGGVQTQTVPQTQVQDSDQLCPAISPSVKIKSALQEMEKQSHQLRLYSPHCSPGK